LDIKNSKFSDWQKIRLQENSEDIPAGSMPRSIDVILRDDIVERCKPGDKCSFTGVVIPVPDVAQLHSKESNFARKKRSNNTTGISGLKHLGIRTITCKLAFLACSCQHASNSIGSINIREGESQEIRDFTDEELKEILVMKNTNEPGIYTKLANSIVPNIFGHEDIKRGILLMLFGGVQKKDKRWNKT
jgi:DNA replication licensing factor MCM6